MKANKKNISIFIIWLVHVSGFMGMLFYDLDFFAGFTSVNLLLMSIILFLNTKLESKYHILSILSIFNWYDYRILGSKLWFNFSGIMNMETT